MKTKKHRLALFISGGGTTMEAIIKATLVGRLDISIACVIASSEKTGGIKKATELGISASQIIVCDPKDFKTIDSFGKKLLEILKKNKVTVITQNGWMPLTPPSVLEEYKDRIFNQHPGPIPEFGGRGMYGKRVHAAVLLYRRLMKQDMWTEVVAQKVDSKFDNGPVVKSRKIPILSGDTVESLQARCYPFEHEVQIAMLNDFVKGRLKEKKKKDVVKDEVLEESKKIARLLYPKG